MRFIFAPIIVILFVPLMAVAQSTKPSMSNDDLEAFANMSFLDKDYDGAQPLLQALADKLKTDPSQKNRLAKIQDEIEVCKKKHVATASPESARATNSTDVRTPHPPPKAGEVLETTPIELGNFEFDAEKGSKIPDDVKALNGTTIRVTGYMVPMDMDEAENIRKFALVPRQTLLPAVQLQQTIGVTCPKGKSVHYCPDEIVVQGKLSVEVQKDDGFIVSIFQIETNDVKSASKPVK